MPLQRKHTAKGIVEDDRTPTLVFLNVCTANRKPWLADHAHSRNANQSVEIVHALGGRSLRFDATPSPSFRLAGFRVSNIRSLGSVLEIDVHKNASQP